MVKDHLRFNVTVIRKDTDLAASFEEVRILFVADGAVSVTQGAETRRLKKTDFILINIFEEARLQTEPGSYIALLTFPYDELLRDTGGGFLRFKMCSLDGSEQRYAEMRFQLMGLVMCFMGDLEESRFQARGLYYLILQSLVTNFPAADVQTASGDEKTGRADELLSYILSNYRSEISITALAEKYYLSRSTASRMIKRYTGEDFPDFVKKLRLEAVRKELTETDLSMTEIALNCGFSSLSVMNRTVREAWNMTPTEYRNLKRTAAQEEPKEEETEHREVFKILSQELEERAPLQEDLQEYRIDLKQSLSWKGWQNRLLNVGPFQALLSARMQEQVLLLKTRLDIEYLRMWNPFSSEMMMFGEEKGSFNFSRIDEALDFCADHQLAVFIDLTPRRERNMASENREISGVASEHRFSSLEEWLETLKAFLMHLRQRYQGEIISRWIVEMSFFINDVAYYDSRNYRPMELWDRSAELVKSLVPGMRVAGPGLIPDMEPGKDEEHIHVFLTHAHIHPDIFTGLHFPYQSRFKSLYSGGYIRNPSRTFLKQEIDKVRQCLDREGFTGEYWVTDWGISIANRNFMQDSCYRGAMILEGMLENLDKADSMGVFYASDLLGFYSDAGNVLSGSGGILSRNGIRKPAYYAFRFIKQLGNRLLLKGPDCAATSGGPEDVRIVCWNKKNPGPRYYMAEEDTFKPQEIGNLFENTNECRRILTVSGLEDGKAYRIRQRVLNTEHGSVLDKWVRLGSQKDLSRDDLEYLNQTSVPEVISEVRQAAEGVIRISVRLKANEMRMIQILPN